MRKREEEGGGFALYISRRRENFFDPNIVPVQLDQAEFKIERCDQNILREIFRKPPTKISPPLPPPPALDKTRIKTNLKDQPSLPVPSTLSTPSRRGHRRFSYLQEPGQ